ncbi:MAG: cysteine synthase A [Arcobacter butzleri]|jgi:cysteine synthase A|nr:cysteine synthase A [Arcobacteraceae bacterium]MDY0364790.1 cysteine synthase A [Arcobacteraceae bacterium]NLO17027.1 cysteine synthase A [Aliarcobacter butzleri]
MKYAQNVRELIGNTPIVKINYASKNALVLAKCEFMNPTSSIKDRIALNMVQTALNEGKIDLNSTIIEPTSGNTGIGLASVCASLGIKLILTMPESMSLERRQILAALGAKIELTSASLGMSGAIEKAKELSKAIENSYILQQFANPSNPAMHEMTTAKEILRDCDGKIDIFVSAVGTGGTISGVAKVLKEYNPKIKIVAIEPKSSAVISGSKAGTHKIQGIGAGFIPQTLNLSLIDEVIQVSDEDAFSSARDIAKNEGLFVGISSGANLFVANLLANKEENQAKTIVTILCDTGERYLSSELFRKDS